MVFSNKVFFLAEDNETKLHVFVEGFESPDLVACGLACQVGQLKVRVKEINCFFGHKLQLDS